MNLPIAFENRMKTLLGNSYEAFLNALLEESAVKGLRVNTHKISTEDFVKNAPFGLNPISYVPSGFIVSEDAQAGKHPYHHAGAYYMQDPGAMATVAAIPTDFWKRTDLKILDLCAAPGGKTTQLASACAQTGGAVLANEYNAARSRILVGNVERMGLSNVCVTNADSKYIAKWYPDFFDLAVIDAPCSGEGMFRKNDLAISEWSPENVGMCAERQKEMLTNGAQCIAPGGYLLYSTCTYATEENEEMIAWFLESHPQFALCACEASVVACTADGIDVSNGRYDPSLCRRFYPHTSPGEGQFVALLKRDENSESEQSIVKDAYTAVPKADASVVQAFLKETVGTTVDGIGVCGGTATAFPCKKHLNFPIPPFGVVAVGAALGELRKGRLIPHHHFFMAFGDRMKSQLVLSPNDSRVLQYLAGEEIEAEGVSGYTAVLVLVGERAITLGGGKASNGRLKNYYPKGLRVR